MLLIKNVTGCWLFLFYFIINQALAQESKKLLLPEDFKLAELMQNFGEKKKLIQAYELPILVALSHYPELKDVRISFRFSRMKSAGLTTFTLWSLFNRNRHFTIAINDDEQKTGVTFKNVSFNAQVGLIGHELAHVVEFRNMTNAGIAIWGLGYLSSKNRKRIERYTDETEINHGLGWQLHEWTNIILESPKTTARYKKMKQTYYLQPKEIIKYIEMFW